MAEISASQVKELREKTGAGMMDCKQALQESGGDMAKAIDYLRKKGLATAAKRAGRATSEGIIQTYIHHDGKLGAMVEIDCETDFVAKSPDFIEFSKNIAMHVAARNPISVSADGIPKEIIEKELEIYRDQVRAMGKPEKMIDKIAEGKLTKFYKESCLLEQEYVQDPTVTIQDLLNGLIAKIGENITIKRFVRFKIGE
ncbi:MAG: translation elongation factor Ts [Thermodesulfobacteriota bacterium]